MRGLLTTLGELIGVAAIAVGAWGFDWRVGLITAGIGALAVSSAAAV